MIAVMPALHIRLTRQRLSGNLTYLCVNATDIVPATGVRTSI